MKLVYTLLVVALALGACKKDAPPTTPDNPPDNTGGGGDPAQTDPSACEVNEDCVAVELECCDACNGGKAVGVHRDHADAVAADSPRGRGECTGTMCTKMACAPWVATCEEGTCSIARGTF